MAQPKFAVKTIPSNIPENAITERIIKCAIEVHRQLGPGLLENVYEEALDIECKLDGLSVVRSLSYLYCIEVKPLVSISLTC